MTSEQRSEGEAGVSHAGVHGKSVPGEGAASAKAADQQVQSPEFIVVLYFPQNVPGLEYSLSNEPL